MNRVPQDPWYQATLPLKALGARLKLQVPHDVFSAMRIDEGTELLLQHLPAGNPKAVLDMGCGYGALGLPIAVRYPEAKVELVDRDLLAVAWAAKNARDNQVENAIVYGSLGYRDIAAEKRYDWILCNVPARIGTPFIEHLLKGGQRLLCPQGKFSAVVIRDLAPVLEELQRRHGWPLLEVARGSRHVVFELTADRAASPEGAPSLMPSDEALYARDSVQVDGLKFDRPYDLHSDDPQLLARGLPVLLDALPRQAAKRVLCFRSGYGPIPLVARSRWPSAQVVAIDRDLLLTAFVRENAVKFGLSGERLEIRECANFAAALDSKERFDLAIGEISAAGGEGVAGAELVALANVLEKGGQALILILEKLERKWIAPIAAKNKLSSHRLIARDGYALLRLASLERP